MFNKNIQTIDDVISQLDAIIVWSIQNKSRIGFFAAIYKNVTKRIKEAVVQGEFQEKSLIEALDITFASRYFTAVEEFMTGQNTQSAWGDALQKSKLKFTIVIQQLLLSMNPHINIDLAIASVSVASEEKLLCLYPDFLKVNTILSSALVEIEKDIYTLSPLLSFLSKFVSRMENKFLNFSLSVARCESWSLACQLVIAEGDQTASLVLRANQSCIQLAKKIVSPGIIGSIFRVMIGIFEVRSIRKIIEVLDNKTL